MFNNPSPAVRLDIQDLADPKNQHLDETDKIYGFRIKYKKDTTITLLLARNNNPAYSCEFALTKDNNLLLKLPSFDPLFPFFDDEDQSRIENMLFSMLFAIDDITKLPLVNSK